MYAAGAHSIMESNLSIIPPCPGMSPLDVGNGKKSLNVKETEYKTDDGTSDYSADAAFGRLLGRKLLERMMTSQKHAAAISESIASP